MKKVFSILALMVAVVIIVGCSKPVVDVPVTVVTPDVTVTVNAQ